MASVYGFAMSLIVAAHLPYGLIVWICFWTIAVYRATAKPRTREAQRVEGLEQSSA